MLLENLFSNHIVQLGPTQKLKLQLKDLDYSVTLNSHITSTPKFKVLKFKSKLNTKYLMLPENLFSIQEVYKNLSAFLTLHSSPPLTMAHFR